MVSKLIFCLNTSYLLPGHELMTPGAGGGQLKYLTSTPYTQHAADQFQPPLGLATPSPYQVDLHYYFRWTHRVEV